MTELRRSVPKGKVRVNRCNFFTGKESLVKDCDTAEEAIILADEYNKNRTWDTDDSYYVYNDQGSYLRGPATRGISGVS